MKSFNRIALAGAVVVLSSATMLGGCSSSRTAVTVQENTTITKGQELIDLQRALEVGAVTKKEYETVRRIIMRQDN